MESKLQDLIVVADISKITDCFHNKFVGALKSPNKGETLLRCSALLDALKTTTPSGGTLDRIEITESRVHRSKDYLDYDVWAIKEGKRIPIDLTPLGELIEVPLFYDDNIPVHEVLSEVFFELLLHGDDQNRKVELLEALKN